MFLDENGALILEFSAQFFNQNLRPSNIAQGLLLEHEKTFKGYDT